jgi:hypothetical protein
MEVRKFFSNGLWGAFKDDWFGPGPIAPVTAPPSVEVRGWDYDGTWNLNVQPRAENNGIGVSFAQLRQFSYDCEILRVIIENQKDNTTKDPFTFIPDMKPGEKPDAYRVRVEKDTRVKKLNKTFRTPDHVNEFPEWARMAVEEILVSDALVLYPRPGLFGINPLFSVDIIDPDTIKILMDETGRRPLIGDQFLQVIKGQVSNKFKKGELFYFIRNPRIGKMYGYPPVEYVRQTIDTAIRRALGQQQHYTHGNIPPMFLRAPESWDLERIKRFNFWWRTYWQMNPEALKQGVLIPHGLDPIFTEKDTLKDEFDEWVARIFCHAIGVSPAPFIKNLNRSTSEQQREAASEEGTAVYKGYLKRCIDRVVREIFGWEDIQFHWVATRPADSLKQAETDQIYVKTGVKSVDEIRAEMGKHPIGVGHVLQLNNGLIALTEEAGGENFKEIILTSQSGKNDPKAGAEEKSPPKAD